MIRICAAALLIAGLAAPGRAQGVAQYLELARQYADGHGSDAETRLAAWSQDEIEAAAIAAALTASARDLVAAARELSLVAAQLQTGDDDPWWDLRIGFDRTSLAWLRAEARRP